MWNDASEHFRNIDRVQPIENKNGTTESGEISFFSFSSWICCGENEVHELVKREIILAFTTLTFR